MQACFAGNRFKISFQNFALTSKMKNKIRYSVIRQAGYPQPVIFAWFGTQTTKCTFCPQLAKCNSLMSVQVCLSLRKSFVFLAYLLTGFVLLKCNHIVPYNSTRSAVGYTVPDKMKISTACFSMSRRARWPSKVP